LWARRNSLALTVRSGIAQFACIGKKCCRLSTLDCNLYSEAFSPNDPNPEHPIPSSITCAAQSIEKSRDPEPSTEQDCNRIASVGRLFGNRRRTEWHSVGAAACSDVVWEAGWGFHPGVGVAGVLPCTLPFRRGSRTGAISLFVQDRLDPR